MFITQIRKLSIMILFLACTSLACKVSVDTGENSPTSPPPSSAAPAIPNTPPAPPEPPTQEIASIPTPTQIPPPSNLTSVNFEGVSFSYDKSLAASVGTEKVPAVPPDPQGSPSEFFPETLKFSFNSYILQNTFHDPIIHIYPVADFQVMDAGVAGRITELRDLITNKPPSPDSIPFLPIWNAAQFMRANVSYINFQSGSGVRFLSMYGQAYSPVNNNSLFYTFQGLTSDGVYYISAVLPVSHPTLPPDETSVPGGDYNAFADNFPNYIVETENQLSAQPASSFSPDLSLLDAAVQSFLIQWQR
jgi:hypothetical protein